MTSVEESEVGIICYISPLPGFRGILKQRYSDFIVNEVDLGGNVVHLTSLEAPLEIAEGKKEKIADLLEKDFSTEIESFRALAGDSDGEKLKKLIDQIVSGVNCNDESVVLSPSSDKTHRTAVHNFFKERLKFLVTDTIDGPDSLSKSIRVRLNSGSNNGRGRNSRKRKDRGDKPYDSRGSDNWPEHIGKFLRFHLYKENKDTQEALGLLGKMLGIKPRSFGFAGTKDKRSVSTQMVTVFKQRAGRLAALNEKLIGIKVGNFCHVNDGLVLGQLQGNRFTITLRSVRAQNEDIVRESATALGKNGFINYFGLQRFGSSSVPTHLIGAALLRGEWKAAVSMILDPREGEKDVTRKIREYYKESGDIEGTLRQLPRYLVAERAILYCFQKCPGNDLQAMLAIPRTLRMIYASVAESALPLTSVILRRLSWPGQAEQIALVCAQLSELFMEPCCHCESTKIWYICFDIEQKIVLASAPTWVLLGCHQVVLGDLVYCKEQQTNKDIISSLLECEDGSGNDIPDDFHLEDIPIADISEGRNTSVKVISEEDIAAEKYTVDDIVLPLPGSRISYPLNDVGKVYHDLAKKDGISLIESAHNSKDFSLTNMTGAYRKVFQKPKDFEWELLNYTDANIPLAETDWDNIVKSRAATIVGESDTKELIKPQIGCKSGGDKCDNEIKQSAGNQVAEQGDDIQTEEPLGQTQEQSHMALKLSFTLPSSCYATMAIRELLKTSTSVAFHKSLN